MPKDAHVHIMTKRRNINSELWFQKIITPSPQKNTTRTKKNLLLIQLLNRYLDMLLHVHHNIDKLCRKETDKNESTLINAKILIALLGLI